MRDLFRKINGHKTYIGVIVLTTFALLGSLDVSVPAWAWTIVSGWTGVAITHKGNKAIAEMRETVVGTGRLRGEIADVSNAIDSAARAGGDGQVET